MLLTSDESSPVSVLKRVCLESWQKSKSGFQKFWLFCFDLWNEFSISNSRGEIWYEGGDHFSFFPKYDQWRNVPAAVKGRIIRLCHSTQFQRESCLAPSITEVLVFVERSPSGISEGCGWGHLPTSLILHAPCGDLYFLMERRVLRPPVVGKVLLPPHLISTQGALLSFMTTLHFSSEQRNPMKRAEWTVQSMVWDWLWGPWYHRSSVPTFPGLVWWWFSNG